MHQEIQIVYVINLGAVGFVEEAHAYVSKVKYSLMGIEYNEYFDNNDLIELGKIGYEEK
jgi:hypothetical protein